MTGGSSAGGGLAARAAAIKRGFVAAYSGSAHLREAVPSGRAGMPQAPSSDIEALHAFARANPIYSGSREMEILGERFTVYEGDISGHWIDSTKHDASRAPFYPTWLVSAYALAAEAARLGAGGAVDVGSGDGRIAYCCAVAGLAPRALELDPGLAALQGGISEATGVAFGPEEADAALLDHASLGMRRPAYFVGGLPQVGEILAGAVVEGALAARPAGGPVFALAGARGAAAGEFGWAPLMRMHGLRRASCLPLPTSWTLEQPEDTPYVFALPAGGPVTGGTPGPP